MNNHESAPINVGGGMDNSPETDKVSLASAALEQLANDNGGPYTEPAAYHGSCARTTFDRPGAEDGTITILVPENRIGSVIRNAFVRIPSILRS
jgi:hypothetical protein